MLAAYLGVLGAGAIPALVPPLSADGRAAVFRETAAELAFADAPRVDEVRASGASRVVPVDLELGPASMPASKPADGLALLLYTSGSTGSPRAVMLSAQNLRFNANEILAEGTVEPGERSLVTLPMHYCYGLSVVHTHLLRGAALVFSGSVLPGQLATIMEDAGVTGLPAVPSLVQTLLRRPEPALQSRIEALRYVMVSGGKLGDAEVTALLERTPRARLHMRYGVTETTAAASFLSPDRVRDKLGSIGRGLRSAPLAVIGDSGRPVVPGSDEVGEIHVHGEHVALGYFGAATDDDDGFTPGAYRTGDLARVDADGFVYVLGRTKTFAKMSGHRVAVEEIEHVLARAPGVLEAAVVGVAHRTRGEALVAMVVVGDTALASPPALRAHCARLLPAFKVPSEFRIVLSLPYTPRGKLDRSALRGLAEETP